MGSIVAKDIEPFGCSTPCVVSVDNGGDESSNLESSANEDSSINPGRKNVILYKVNPDWRAPR